MFRCLQVTGVWFCFLSTIDSGAFAQEPTDDMRVIEGLWSGAWGGGESNGVVYQPVIAQLFVKGNHVELYGLRDNNRLVGELRVDASVKQLHIAYSDEGSDQSIQNTVAYAYDVKGNELTLTDSAKYRTTLRRIKVHQDPLANTGLELVQASGINEAGDLLVTEFAELRVGRLGVTYYQPMQRSLKTDLGVVGVVLESGWRTITIAEARKRIHEATCVAIIPKQKDRKPSVPSHTLWNKTGAPKPDSEAVRQTLSKTLRPGTLVFILASPKLPPP